MNGFGGFLRFRMASVVADVRQPNFKFNRIVFGQRAQGSLEPVRLTLASKTSKSKLPLSSVSCASGREVQLEVELFKAQLRRNFGGEVGPWLLLGGLRAVTLSLGSLDSLAPSDRCR